MRSVQRSILAFIMVAAVLAILVGVLGSSRLAAGSSTAEANNKPLIQSGQKPRVQDFFPGNSANFTVSITNTGSVELQSVSVTNATTADCNRGNLGTLAPGQSTSYTCARGGPGGVTESFLNELQANGQAGQTTVSHRSNAFVNVLNPDLRITKSPQTQTVKKGGTAFFTVTIFNTSDFIMMIDEVDDKLNNNCDRNPTTTILLLAGDSLDYICSQTNVQDPMPAVISVTGHNPLDESVYVATDIAWVELLSLEASLTPDVATIPEPGGLVTYTVEVVNTGSPNVTLNGLSTEKFGNLFNANNPAIEAATNTCLQGAGTKLSANGGTYTCTYVAPVSGQPSQFNDVLTVNGTGSNGIQITATDDATVTISNVPASMMLNLGANPSFINPPSGLVSFSVQVLNTSSADAITITEMTDEFLGNLDGKGTCALPVPEILPGFSYQCQFSATVSGQIGQQKSRTISVKAIDDDPAPSTLTDSDVVTVSIIQQPEQKIYMPNVTDDNDPIDEPNNSCANAHRMITNRQYYVQPPDKYPADQDYFSFELTQLSRVTIDLNNFVPLAGQMVVRYDDTTKPSPNCLKVWDRKPRLTLNNTMNLGQMPAGRYYIQIINDGPSGVNALYGLITRVN